MVGVRWRDTPGPASHAARIVQGTSPARLCGVASLLLLASYACAVLLASRSLGVPFSALEPFPLGGGPGAGVTARGASLLLALTLGWGVPGLSLALLADPRARGPSLLGRALGLGVGYLMVTGIGHALLVGRAPGRVALLLLLALPPLAALLRPEPPDERGAPRDPTVVAALALMAVLTLALWPKLAREGMDGDATEAYELARSLEAHVLQHWDLERWEGPGRFGTPAVSPALTRCYLVSAGMALLGRGELAARLPFVPALVLCGALAAGCVAQPRRSGWLYVASVTALYALWNSYYVGYEPSFKDLAGLAGSDTLMTALWLAGFGEVVGASVPLGIGFLLLASGVLYSAPVLSAFALVGLFREDRGQRALLLGVFAGALSLAVVWAVGVAKGDLADWIRQVRSEYWQDLVDQRLRTPSLPILGQLLLLTGCLPLVAILRRDRLTPGARALLVAGAAYVAFVVVSSYKNLHYVAPLPFLLAPPALEASGTRLRAAATALVLAALALSWPSPRAIHRETVQLGEVSCVDGLGYEEAVFGGDVVYRAFSQPGRGDRFAVGKHTFVRYALDLGKDPCAFRLSGTVREGWIPVAGQEITLSVRDPDLYARWRFLQPPVPSSWLFRRPARKALGVEAREWPGRSSLADEPGSALVIEKVVGRHLRLLAPITGPSRLLIGTSPSKAAIVLTARVNGGPSAELPLPAGATQITLSTESPPWRHGWNVLELASPTGIDVEWIEAAP